MFCGHGFELLLLQFADTTSIGGGVSVGANKWAVNAASVEKDVVSL